MTDKLDDQAVNLEEMATSMLKRLEREFGAHGVVLKDADPDLRATVEQRIAEQFVATLSGHHNEAGLRFTMQETIKRAREIEAARAEALSDRPHVTN